MFAPGGVAVTGVTPWDETVLHRTEPGGAPLNVRTAAELDAAPSRVPVTHAEIAEAELNPCG